MGECPAMRAIERIPQGLHFRPSHALEYLDVPEPEIVPVLSLVLPSIGRARFFQNLDLLE